VQPARRHLPTATGRTRTKPPRLRHPRECPLTVFIQQNRTCLQMRSVAQSVKPVPPEKICRCGRRSLLAQANPPVPARCSLHHDSCLEPRGFLQRPGNEAHGLAASCQDGVFWALHPIFLPLRSSTERTRSPLWVLPPSAS